MDTDEIQFICFYLRLSAVPLEFVFSVLSVISVAPNQPLRTAAVYNWVCFSEIAEDVFGFQRAFPRGPKHAPPHMSACAARSCAESFRKPLRRAANGGNIFILWKIALRVGARETTARDLGSIS